ncbi:MAG: hypothetical protein ACHQ1D_13665, partial [Nitrososphaerales archaeon]
LIITIFCFRFSSLYGSTKIFFHILLLESNSVMVIVNNLAKNDIIQYIYTDSQHQRYGPLEFLSNKVTIKSIILIQDAVVLVTKINYFQILMLF